MLVPTAKLRLVPSPFTSRGRVPVPRTRSAETNELSGTPSAAIRRKTLPGGYLFSTFGLTRQQYR